MPKVTTVGKKKGKKVTTNGKGKKKGKPGDTSKHGVRAPVTTVKVTDVGGASFRAGERVKRIPGKLPKWVTESGPGVNGTYGYRCDMDGGERIGLSALARAYGAAGGTVTGMTNMLASFGCDFSTYLPIRHVAEGKRYVKSKGAEVGVHGPPPELAKASRKQVAALVVKWK